MEPAAVDGKPEVFSYADGEVTSSGLRRAHLRIATGRLFVNTQTRPGSTMVTAQKSSCPFVSAKSTPDHAAHIATLRMGPSSRCDLKGHSDEKNGNRFELTNA
jgi:hypothetical protein